MTESLRSTLDSLIGEAHVQAWPQLEPTWQTQIQGAIAAAPETCLFVSPSTPAELAAIITAAAAHRCPIIPTGSGSKLPWGTPLPRSADVPESPSPTHPPSHPATLPLLILSTQRLDCLIEHAVGDLTVTAEAGIPLAILQAILAEQGQFLAIDPAFPERATLGGVVATADTGSLRQRYLGVRDMLLGVEFVRADGQAAKAGGRVVKNVAGYDLMKLLTGSYGSLAVMTQFTFRVYPLPEASQTVVLSGGVGTIAQAAQTLLGSALTPSRADLLSAGLMQHFNLGKPGDSGLAVQFQSIAASVKQQSQRLTELGQMLGLTVAVLDGTSDANLWRQLPNRMVAIAQPSTIVCKIGIAATAAQTLLQQVDELNQAWGSAAILAQIHAASGLGRLFCPGEMPTEMLLKLRQICQAGQGFLSVLQAPAPVKQSLDVWGYSGSAIAPMRAIKQQFDPHRLLSPGRFVGGI
jgi:glycolate oxidase FAD binding subunit